MPLGKDAGGWAYYSTSEVLHADNEGRCVGELLGGWVDGWVCEDGLRRVRLTGWLNVPLCLDSSRPHILIHRTSHGGPQGSGASEPFGSGDVIGVELDMHEGTVRFLKNDRDIGLFFSGLRQHPARLGGEGFEVSGILCYVLWAPVCAFLAT